MKLRYSSLLAVLCLVSMLLAACSGPAPGLKRLQAKPRQENQGRLPE